MNIYHGQWIKHPAQNNLYPLPEEEKRLVIDDFMKRKPADEVMNGGKANYEDWLRCQFGDYFAEHFPMAYTRKYWMKEARQLRTEWVGNRLYQPSVDEVIAGSKAEDTRVTYYAKEMRYPQHGGFRAFFEPLAREARIQYRTRVTAIDPKERVVTDSEGRTYKYKRLITSAPPPAGVSAHRERRPRRCAPRRQSAGSHPRLSRQCGAEDAAHPALPLVVRLRRGHPHGPRTFPQPEVAGQRSRGMQQPADGGLLR
jgi:protoporphyrinogen oxidase